MIADAIQILSGLRAELFSSLTFCLGFWLGHRLELGRDRIRDFNTAVVPVRAYLLCQIETPVWGHVRAPTLIEVDAFDHSLGRFRRKGFRRAWERQKRESQSDMGATYDPNTGDVTSADYTRLLAALRACLRYTQRR